MKPLEKPLTRDQIKELQKDSGVLTVVIPMDFYDLVDNDMEGVNDIAECDIVDSGGTLTDISYKPVGVDNGSILVEITGVVIFFDEEDDEENEEDDDIED